MLPSSEGEIGGRGKGPQRQGEYRDGWKDGWMGLFGHTVIRSCSRDSPRWLIPMGGGGVS